MLVNILFIRNFMVSLFSVYCWFIHFVFILESWHTLVSWAVVMTIFFYVGFFSFLCLFFEHWPAFFVKFFSFLCIGQKLFTLIAKLLVCSPFLQGHKLMVHIKLTVAYLWFALFSELRYLFLWVIFIFKFKRALIATKNRLLCSKILTFFHVQSNSQYQCKGDSDDIGICTLLYHDGRHTFQCVVRTCSSRSVCDMR